MGERVEELVFSHGGRLLAGRSYGDEIKLWHIETGTEISIPQASVEQLAFSPDDRLMAAISWDQIALYDAATGVILRRLGSRAA